MGWVEDTEDVGESVRAGRRVRAGKVRTTTRKKLQHQFQETASGLIIIFL